MKFFLIHGAYGNPNENWFPWLKKELEKLDHEVFIPKFSTPKNQSLENWMKVFEKYLDEIDENTIFIGHSLGPAFILSVLEQINVKVKACFFVSPFLGKIGNSDFDTINESFVCKEFAWKKIKNNCSEFFTYFGDNDPYLKLTDAIVISEALDCEINIVENGGHLNENAGFKEFPMILKDIKSII